MNIQLQDCHCHYCNVIVLIAVFLKLNPNPLSGEFCLTAGAASVATTTAAATSQFLAWGLELRAFRSLEY